MPKAASNTKYHHKSGAQKRKEKNERVQKEAAGQKHQRTLTALGFHNRPTNVSEISNINDSDGDADIGVVASTSENRIMVAPDPPVLMESDNHYEEHIGLENSDTSEKIVHESNEKLAELQTHETQPEQTFDFDIGTIEDDFLSPQKVEEIICRGHLKMPNTFPCDRSNEKFPASLLAKILPNGEKVPRDWLVWSQQKSAFFCLPCQLLHVQTSNGNSSISTLCTAQGYSSVKKWQKLYEKLSSHENNYEHFKNYVKWRELEVKIRNNSGIHHQLSEEIKTESDK